MSAVDVTLSNASGTERVALYSGALLAESTALEQAASQVVSVAVPPGASPQLAVVQICSGDVGTVWIH